MYIVIEGQDATGKSTQVEMLANYLREQGKEVVTMHEPDGDLESAQALDVTIQAQILELMLQLQKELGMAIIMITHDMGVIASICDEMIVMYAGGVCERGTTDAVFYHPMHEYTKGLMRSIPDMSDDEKTRLARQSARDDNSAKDTFESKPSEFQHKVDAAYLHIAKDLGVQTVDASPSADEIQTTLRKMFGV